MSIEYTFNHTHCEYSNNYTHLFNAWFICCFECIHAAVNTFPLILIYAFPYARFALFNRIR